MTNAMEQASVVIDAIYDQLVTTDELVVYKIPITEDSTEMIKELRVMLISMEWITFQVIGSVGGKKWAILKSGTVPSTEAEIVQVDFKTKTVIKRGA